VAWAVHDLEELLTVAAWSGRLAARLRRQPGVPAWLSERVAMPQRQVTVAIGLVGLVTAAASVAGARSGGRSAFYRAMLAGFGWHAVTHVAPAAALRSYTPGLVTTPLVVVPFSLWAWRRLWAAGVTGGASRPPASSLALLPPVLLAAHGAAHLLTARRSGGSRRRAR
jgi:uncharacterized protein with HXXEE motif